MIISDGDAADADDDDGDTCIPCLQWGLPVNVNKSKALCQSIAVSDGDADDADDGDDDTCIPFF